MLRFFHLWKPGRHVHYRGCIPVPDDQNLRPDPYIYSQDWLRARGMAYTWDNPDVSIIDDATGDLVNRHDLIDGHSYTVRAKIHNHSSTVAALDTLVLFRFKDFGIQGHPVLDLGSDVIDVPNGGSAIAETSFAPPRTGHFCLIVTIVHSNDANDQNNVGQHNCDVTSPDAPYARTVPVRNDRNHSMRVALSANRYRLPAEPMRAKSASERRSEAYMRRLQAANRPGDFPVPESAGLVIEPDVFDLAGGESREVTVRLPPGFRGSVNIDAVSSTNVLLGGITIVGGEA